MKLLPLSAASVLLSAAVLGLAGCAWQSAESDTNLTRVAGWNQPAPEDKAPPAKTSVAEPKKAPARTAIAKSLQAPQQLAQGVAGDEAGCTGVDTCGSV